MSDHFYGVIEAGSGRLGHITWAAYGPVDADKPPAVLVHGLADSSACWPGVVEHLAEDRLVVVTDMRGHGNAALPDEPLTLNSLADDLAQVVRQVAQRPAALIGHSLGGLAVLNFALRAPALTAGLVLEDPALHLREGHQMAPQITQLINDILTQARTTSYVSLITEGRKQNPDWSDDEFAPWAQAKKQLNPKIATIPHTLTETNWVEALAQVAPDKAFPVVIIAGDPQRGSVVSTEDGDRAAELLAERGRIIRLDAGHCVRRDQRERFLEILDEVLPN